MEIGQEVGKYRILKKLGEGGFGAVYQAEHVLMKRLCAVKTLHKSMAADERVISRFKREGQVASRFKHVNAIEVYDFDCTPDGTFYIAMEFLSGETLRDRLQREGALPVATALEIMVQILAALNAAHRGGVVHRDLKPENVFLEKREESPHFVKVLDFGIAKLHEISQGADGAALTSATKQGDFFGTPRYASPEQCLGEEVDARSDIYTAGIILYEMLVGKLPFVSQTPSGYLAQHLYVAPPPMRGARPDVPEPLEAIVQKALAKKREDRYQSAAEMIDAISDAASALDLPVSFSASALAVKTPGPTTLRRMGIGRRRRSLLLPLVLGVVVLAAGGVVVAIFKPWKKTDARGAGGGGGLEVVEDPAARIARLRAEADELRAKVEKAIAEENYREALALLTGRRSTTEADWIDRQIEELQARQGKLEREAYDRLQAARLARAKNPGDYSQALYDMGEVARIYRHTDVGDAAAAEAAKLKAEWELAAERAFTEIKAAVDALVEKGEYEAAIAKANDFPAAHTKTSFGPRVVELIEGLKRLAAANPESERRAARELADAEAALAAKPDDLAAAIARLEAIARKYQSQSGERAVRRAAELREKREALAAEEWARRGAERAAHLAAGRWDEAVRVCAEFPDSLSPSKAREAADQALEEVRNAAQREETAARARADALRAEGRLGEAIRALDPFAALKHRELAAVRADAEAAVAALEKVAALHKDMVLIPGGTYTIGSDGRANEQPPHAVELAAFWIDRYEVTNEQYALFLEDAGARAGIAPPRGWPGPRPPEGEERLPVVNVTQHDAVAFLRWAGKRLPTEEEWEAAARGPEAASFPWGAARWNPAEEPRRALIGRTADGRRGPVPVDSPDFEDVSKLGVVGLAGNVSEWTSSIFKIYPGHKNPPSNEREPGQGVYGVVRGGNFTLPIPAPMSYRYALPRGDAARFIGFRGAKDAAEGAKD